MLFVVSLRSAVTLNNHAYTHCHVAAVITAVCVKVTQISSDVEQSCIQAFS